MQLEYIEALLPCIKTSSLGSHLLPSNRAKTPLPYLYEIELWQRLPRITPTSIPSAQVGAGWGTGLEERRLSITLSVSYYEPLNHRILMYS